MGLFRKENKFEIGNICPKCEMKFSSPERTLRHMARAHPVKKRFNCDTCGFRN